MILNSSIKLMYRRVIFSRVISTFTVDNSNFEKLKNEGAIEDFYDEPGTLNNWYNIKIDERLTVNLYGLEKEVDSASHEVLQITEKNTITLAHSFLSQYITIWDTKNKVIHVLEKK